MIKTLTFPTHHCDKTVQNKRTTTCTYTYTYTYTYTQAYGSSCPMSAYRLALGGYGPWGTFFERFPCGKGSHGSHDVGAIIKEYYGHQPPLWPRPQQHDPHFVDTFLDDGTGKGKGKGKGNDNDQPPPGPGRTATATINTSTWAPASSTWSLQGSAYGAAMGAPRDLHRSTSSAAQGAPR